MSYMPKYPAISEPATTPVIGAQSRNADLPLSAITRMTSRVTTKLRGAAKAGVSCGTSSIMSKAIGMTVTAISMITVPDTVGVRMRRSSESRPESTNWNREDTNTKVARSAGPPCLIAAMHTAMKVADVPMTST